MEKKERDIRVEMFRMDEHFHPFVMLDYVHGEGILQPWGRYNS